MKFVLPFNAGCCIFNFSVLQIGLLAGKVMDLQPDSETTGEVILLYPSLLNFFFELILKLGSAPTVLKLFYSLFN